MKSDSNLELLPLSHRAAFRNIRNFLAGRLLGATRDRALMDELFKCVFAKHWLIKMPDLSVSGQISKSYRNAFRHVKKVFPGIFLASDEIEIDPVALQYVDQQLDAIDVEQCRADVFSELYEAFAESGVKSSEGQFFTPSVAVNLLVDLVGLKGGQSICDPACGAGGFLIAAAKRLIDDGSDPAAVAHSVYGIDKDAYLARIARGRLALFLDDMPGVYCGDSLAGITQDGKSLPNRTFDVILTNPPFGSKIISASQDTLSEYELARKWLKSKDNEGHFICTNELNAITPPQILFVERCLKLLKPGGLMGAILPESLVSSKSHGFVVQYLKKHADLVAVVGMPEALFKTSGKGGTHTKTVAITVQKRPNRAGRDMVFFADAKWCGHDSRGRQIPLNDIPKITENFETFAKKNEASSGSLGIAISADRLGLNLAPRAFEFDFEAEKKRISKTHEIISVGELIAEEVLSISTGDEVGKLAYGTGDIPFVRTSDLSNWEIKLDTKHCVSQEIYDEYKDSQDVRPLDILMVRDGTYLIGTCAMITRYDLPMLYQSHIFKIRVNDTKRINPFILLAALSSNFAQRQIKSFCISQDIIDSLGDKIHQISLALPKSEAARRNISQLVEKSINDRIEARELARRACEEVMAQ